MVCSSDCATAFDRNERAVHVLLEKSAQTARATAFYCYLCAALSGAAAIVAWFMLPLPFLILFTGGCALVLFVAGFWHGRVAQQHNPD